MFTDQVTAIVEDVLAHAIQDALDEIRRQVQSLQGASTNPNIPDSDERLPKSDRSDGSDENTPDAVVSSNAQSAVDLSQIELNCRVKAKASRWAAERMRQMQSGADYELEIKPFDQEVIQEGKGQECYLWMCSPNSPSPDDLSSYDTLALWYETLAESIAIVQSLVGTSCTPRPYYERSLKLLAEAQAAVRKMASDFGRSDLDQSQVFYWLRQAGEREGIYFDRFLRADDCPDTNSSSDLRSRISQLAEDFNTARHRERLQRKQIAKLRYASTKIAQGEAENGHWNTISRTVAELKKGGLPNSNVQLRELLTPILDRRPAEERISPELIAVLQEIDRFHASRTIVATPLAKQTMSSDVAKVARLLRSRKVVLIGGDGRPETQQAIEEAFQLDELIWLTTDSHVSYRRFEPTAARPDVAAVLLAIRWASHSYGNIKSICDQSGKPLVRLPNGLNPNQIAAQIMQQASGQLRANRRAIQGR